MDLANAPNESPQSSSSSSSSSSCRGRICSCLRSNAFVIFLIAGVFAGVALGVAMRYAKTDWTARELAYYKFPGEMLLRMLKMMILPLVVTSMVSGMASLNQNSSSWIGLRAVFYYMTTTLIAVVIGLVLVVSIRPGAAQNSANITREGSSKTVNAADSFLDLVRNAFPDNIVDACVRKVQTEMVFDKPGTIAPTSTVPTLDSNFTAPSTAAATTDASSSTATSETSPAQNGTSSLDYTPVLQNVWGSNLLGVIVFSIAFGMALNSIGEQGETTKSFFIGCNEAVLAVVRVVIWYTPIGILFLVSGKIIEMKNVGETLTQLGLYSATVMAGLAVHGFIVLPMIYLLIVRKNPFKYMLGCLQALLTAVSTSSSSATLPVTFYCIEEVNGVNKLISRFVLPIGATINMDGTALYEAVATVFIAQLNGITLGFVQLVTISVTATAAAIGAAGVPEAGLVTMVIVLTAVGLPTDDVTLILAIDWFLDRMRTSINVWGDAVGAAVVEKLSIKDIDETAANDNVAYQHYELNGEIDDDITTKM